MHYWYEKILSSFVTGIKPITIVVDTDHLLSEETILSKLKDMHFVVEPFEEALEFRYLYETKYRPYIGEKDFPELLISASDISILPFDIISKSTIIEVSLNDIFPNLNWQVVSSLDKQYFNRLYSACQNNLAEKLGSNVTKDFILRHVFEIAPEIVNRPEDLIVVLLRRHYKNIHIPEVIDEYLISKLILKECFREWPLHEIVPSRNKFWAFLQENWKIYLKSIEDNTIQSVVPFEHDDIRVYIDNLFTEGFLKPLEISLGDSPKKPWVIAGLFHADKTQYERYKSLFDITRKSLPNIESSYNEWISFSIKYAKLISTYHSFNRDDSNLRSFRGQANDIFEKWMMNKYSSLASLPSIKPAMVHHIPRWMASQKMSKQALVVVDGLSLSQWFTIESEIKHKTNNYNITESALFAWVPTITSVSRQSIFSGKTPLYFSDSIFTTHKEGKMWFTFWKNHGLTDKEICYKKNVGKSDKDIVELCINQEKSCIGITINVVDDIMHGMQLGEIGMHNQVRLWANNGPIINMVKKLIENDYRVIITSDHGNLEGVGIGSPSEGVVPEIRGQRLRIYTDIDLCKRAQFNFEDTIIWPPVGLPENVHCLFAKNEKVFGKLNHTVVSHGGISLEETIVPFIIIDKQCQINKK